MRNFCYQCAPLYVIAFSGVYDIIKLNPVNSTPKPHIGLTSNFGLRNEEKAEDFTTSFSEAIPLQRPRQGHVVFLQ
jgi:hypothetical protein